MSDAMMAAARLYNDPRFFSPSEVRIRENKIRRQKIVRRQYFTIISLVTVILFLAIFFGFSLLSDAQSEDFVTDYKYYKSVTIHAGDTLTDIARNYYNADKYKSIDQYISEIEDINQLVNTSSINAGEQLIVPYYSTEFK